MGVPGQKIKRNMIYNNITRTAFIDRPNRFIARVDLGGHRETVHVKNTGRCKELLLPGVEVWLTASGRRRCSSST